MPSEPTKTVNSIQSILDDGDLSTYANPLYSSLRLERRLKDGNKTQGSEKTQVKERRLKVGEKTSMERRH